MKRELYSWYSPRLEREMPVAVYGDYGFALVAGAYRRSRFLEYERFGLIESCGRLLTAAK
jgi:esterase/lipase superfamily enzyme